MARLLLQPTELLQAVACTAVVAAAGLLVALGVRLQARVLLPLAAGFALVAGSAIAGHSGAVPPLLGETVALAVLTTLLTQLLAPPHPRWLAIAVRVGGSWITAASLLMLGWLARQPWLCWRGADAGRGCASGWSSNSSAPGRCC